VTRKRTQSDDKFEILVRVQVRVRPLLIMLRFVDMIKQRWDMKALGLSIENTDMKADVYLNKLFKDYLSGESLSLVVSDCEDMSREYKDKILKIVSVEEFLIDLGLKDSIES